VRFSKRYLIDVRLGRIVCCLEAGTRPRVKKSTCRKMLWSELQNSRWKRPYKGSRCKVLAGKLVSFRRSLDVRLNVQGVRLDELYACKAILGKPCWIFRLESLPASMTRCKMNLQDASLLSPSAPFHLFSKWGLMGSGKDSGLCRIRHKLDHVGLCVMSDR
jgi:hypothetical protein